MKRYVQKSDSLSLVPRNTRAHDLGKEDNAAPSRDSFDGWLNSVAPALVQATHPEDDPNVSDRYRRRALSLDEVSRVNFATVREGTEHRHWPPEVVLSFLAAEVIKRKQR